MNRCAKIESVHSFLAKQGDTALWAMTSSSSRLTTLLIIRLYIAVNLLIMGIAESLTAQRNAPRTAIQTAPSSSTQDNRCWLVVDFDGTCSELDTTTVLPRLASMLERNSQDMDQRLSTFTELENEFFSLYNAAKENMCSKTMSLDEALDTLDDASNHVTEKVSSSGVLRGLCVPPERIMQIIDKDKDVSDRVRLRPGCAEVIAKATNKQWRLGVLSINWCPSLIESALTRALVQQSKYKTSAMDNLEMPIWSNYVDEAGVVSLRVPGALAKKERIVKLKSSLGDNSTVVYVGDSSTDLAALVEADVGILIGQSKSTISMAKLWGVKVLPLKQRHEMMEEGENTSNVIWTVDSWSEIETFLVDRD